MNGAGQGLTVQIATVLPAGKSGAAGLAIAQVAPDATAGNADFGQILAEQFAGQGDSKPVAVPVLAEEPGQILQQLDLLTGSPEQVSTQRMPMENQSPNNEAAPMAAILVAGTTVQIGLDIDTVNGDSLPSSGEVLPVIAASAAASQPALELEAEAETEIQNKDPSAEPEGVVIDNGLPANRIAGDLPIQPQASVVLPTRINGSSDDDSIGDTPIAAAVSQAAASTLVKSAQSGSVLAGGLQNPGFQIAEELHLKHAESPLSGNEKTDMETIRSVIAAQGKLNSSTTSGDLTASGANPDATLAEHVTQSEPGTGSAWRSALLGYSRLESGQPASVGIQIPVGQKGWTESVMERVFWLGGQHINNAEIHLDPPELGPLQLHISSKGDQTSVFFSSSHASVREALEQGLPRLKEMLESSGLQLMDVNVSDRSPQQQAREEARQIQSLAATEDGQEVRDGTPLIIKVPLGLVDDYA